MSGLPPLELGYAHTELRRELVDAVPAAEIDEEFARDEGEGYDSVEEWRSAHERFFDRPIGQDTPIVAVRFRVVEQL
ncbi:MAG TPA: ASCH domain-containing protein [Gaiellaceae bacterium]|nr:ASCH domain-containing protein [Gaiellaceae bacterium]